MKKKWIFWKGVGLMFKILGLIIIVAIFTPIGYFAWRAGQPMSMPEYDSRTFYALLAERRRAYDDLALEYQESHPSEDVKDGMCFRAEVLVTVVNTFPWSGLCAASEFLPYLRVYGSRSQQLGCGQMGGTWRNFPVTWWDTFEILLYNDLLSTAPHGPVPYCRIPPP